MTPTAAPPLRLGLLSTARINRHLLSAGAEGVEIVAVASRDRSRATAHAREWGLPIAHGGYEALLADDRVDAVYVSLPNGLHHEWTLRALAAGKHVLCEKPYSPRPADVEEAWTAAARAGLVVAEAFMYRHHPQTRRLGELVRGGAIGRLRLVRAAFSFPLANEADVRMRPDLDGGALLDVGCYCVSGSRLLAGEPERVLAEQVVGPTGVDVAFHGTLRFRDDVVAQFDASFLVPVRQSLEAVGEEGTLIAEAPWRPDWGGRVLLDGTPVDMPEGDSYRLELEDFARAIRGETPPLLGRDDALGQARALDALRRAAASGVAASL